MDPLPLPDLTAISLVVREGISLRSFKADDAKAIFERVRANIDHLHFMHWITPDYSLESARGFVERSMAGASSGESLSLGLFDKDEFIGTVGCVHFDVNARRTEIGYWIDSAYEGKGIITAATKTLIDFVFYQMGMNRIEIRCSAENVRSSAVPQRLGFRQEAQLREHEVREGRFQDFLTFGLLRSDAAAAFEKNNK